MYTVAETAKILKIAEKTLRNKISLGTISCTRVAGRSVRFTDADIRAMLQAVPAGQKKAPVERQRGPKAGNNHRIDAILQRACSAEGVN